MSSVLGVPIRRQQSAAAIQMCATDSHVFILLANGDVCVLEGKTLQVVTEMCVEKCRAMASDGQRVFAVCSDGSVMELSLDGPRRIANLGHDLACCALHHDTLCIGCDDVPHGSLIIVLNVADLSSTEIVDGHLGSITKVKFCGGALFSSAVDGLVCKYNAEYEIERVFNVDASVMDFDVRKGKLLVLTDIHTVALIDTEAEGPVVKLARPHEQFGVFCVACKHGPLVFYTNESGTLACYKAGKKDKMVQVLDLPGHSAFVQDGFLVDKRLFAIDEGNYLTVRDIDLLKN